TIADQLPTGRKGRPEEMAWMVMMLLTPAASYVSGATSLVSPNIRHNNPALVRTTIECRRVLDT
ncbi:MAG: hypothetical protein AAF327_02965, partial [Cyanobacteria bacterium P01_A01_bin.37]